MNVSPRVTWCAWGLVAIAMAAFANEVHYRRSDASTSALEGAFMSAAAAPASAPRTDAATAKPTASSGITDVLATAPPLGTTDTIDLTPRVPRASGTPCVVELFRDIEFREPGPAYFEDGATDQFPYTPPTNCPGPWAKVIVKVAWSADNPSAYYDGLTTAQVEIGGVPLYAGGGQFNQAPTHWRAERDVTDYSAMLRAPGLGRVAMMALPRYSDRFRAAYRVSATLLFYPANPNNRAQRVPDQVHAMSPQGFGAITTPSAQLATTFTLPRNIERAYLDVIAQPYYGNDLHWYSCMPDALLTEFPELTHQYAIGSERLGLEGGPVPQGCRGGSFREVQVSIDGQPAGIAPVIPKVHTEFSASWGGTRLSQPFPVPRALSYLPYRVDLTPFAGPLSDGAPHTVALSMNSGGGTIEFIVSGTLLVYRDPQTTQVTGQVTRNTMPSMFAPTLSDTLHRNAAGEVTGVVQTRSIHQYEIEGYIDTARGRIESAVSRSFSYKNKQSVYARDVADTDPDAYSLIIELENRSTAFTQRSLNGQLIADDEDYLVMPMTLIYQYGRANLLQTISQRTERWRPGVTRYYVRLRQQAQQRYEQVASPGTAAQWSAAQSYLFRDSHGSCYRVDASAEQGALTAYQEGMDCPDSRNRFFWAARPDGSPYELGWIGP